MHSYYSSVGDPTHSTTLTSQQFRKFTRDANILAPTPADKEKDKDRDRPPVPVKGKRLPSAVLDLLFTKYAAATTASAGASAGVRKT